MSSPLLHVALPRFACEVSISQTRLFWKDAMRCGVRQAALASRSGIEPPIWIFEAHRDMPSLLRYSIPRRFD